MRTPLRHGNSEGKSILEFVGDMEQRPALIGARSKLYEVREERVHPGLDDKVLTSWNGLMLDAFAEAAQALDREDYQRAAARNAEFLLQELRQENGRLHQVLAQMQSIMAQYPLGFGQWLQGRQPHSTVTT